ncbi:MAG: hypothetical protein ACREQ5_03590 [Candidatus Dormibacteria bacterium]
MTTAISLSPEDLPLLGGVALAIAGTVTHSTDLVVAGLALIGGKAVLKTSSSGTAPATAEPTSKS